MKTLRIKLFWSLSLALTAMGGAFAQTANSVPGPEDYPAFTRFVTDRNIFDPNREPHSTSTRPRTYRPRTSRVTGAPTFSLVGTMSYNKGMFAFFNGTSGDLKKALPVSESIAGYKILAISQGHVRLETPDKKNLELKVGDTMRQENGKWELAGGETLPETGAAEPASATTETSGATPAPAANPALESNDVLKRLMQQREKDNQ